MRLLRLEGEVLVMIGSENTSGTVEAVRPNPDMIGVFADIHRIHAPAGIQFAAAQGAALLVGLGQKVQPDPGGLGGEPGQQGRADRLHEAVAGSQAEGAF